MTAHFKIFPNEMQLVLLGVAWGFEFWQIGGVCWRGGTGRRGGLKIRSLKGRVGSIPSASTKI